MGRVSEEGNFSCHSFVLFSQKGIARLLKSNFGICYEHHFDFTKSLEHTYS